MLIFPLFCVLCSCDARSPLSCRMFCEYKLITKADVNGLSCQWGRNERGRKKEKLKSKKPSFRSELYLEIIQKCCTTRLFMFQE